MKHSFSRFLVVGMLNTIVGLSFMYLLLHVAGFSYWISTFLGNSIGACVSYFLNRSFTFKSQGSILKSVCRFVIVILCCYFISYDVAKNIAVWFLTAINLANQKAAADLAVLCGAGLYTILNYFGQKLFVFSEKAVKIKGINES